MKFSTLIHKFLHISNDKPTHFIHAQAYRPVSYFNWFERYEKLDKPTPTP